MLSINNICYKKCCMKTICSDSTGFDLFKPKKEQFIDVCVLIFSVDEILANYKCRPLNYRLLATR